MYNFLDPELNISHPELKGQEAHHAVRVLRLRAGTKVCITDGRGTKVTGDLQLESDGTCPLLHPSLEQIAQPVPLHLAIGILHDADRMEWLVEKITEIGVSSISFLTLERSERAHIRKDRLEKISVSALKQSGGSWLPEITGPEKLSEWLQRIPQGNRFVGYMPKSDESHLIKLAQAGVPSAFLVGPEGDLTEAEFMRAVAAGFSPVSLGANTLRSETAALMACLTLKLVNTPH